MPRSAASPSPLRATDAFASANRTGTDGVDGDWASVVAGLVEAHRREIWTFLRVLGCDPATADDLAQETFLAVLRKPFQERSPRETAAYLRTAARHRFVSAMRAQRARPRFADLDEAEVAFEAERREGAYDDALDGCLSRLPERSRAVLEQRYRDGATSRDLGAAFGIEPAHVDTLIHRAKAALRRCIEERIRHDDA